MLEDNTKPVLNLIKKLVIMNALQFQKKLLSMQENMMNFALMLTANRDDAQDLMQDTTLKVLDN